MLVDFKPWFFNQKERRKIILQWGLRTQASWVVSSNRDNYTMPLQSFFFLFVKEKDVKSLKSLFQPVNGLWSTRYLAKIHNRYQ